MLRGEAQREAAAEAVANQHGLVQLPLLDQREQVALQRLEGDAGLRRTAIEAGQGH